MPKKANARGEAMVTTSFWVPLSVHQLLCDRARREGYGDSTKGKSGVGKMMASQAIRMAQEEQKTASKGCRNVASTTKA